MTGLHDLQTRADEVEKAVGESNDQNGDLLAGIRDGLSAVRDRLIHMRIENDRLGQENAQLKQIIEQLLGSLENKSRSALHDMLKDLDLQLNALLRLSDNESAAVLGDLERLQASKSHGLNRDSDELEDVAAREPNGAYSNESSLLEETRDRVRRLFEQLPEDDRQTDLPESSAAIRRPRPEPVARDEPVEPHGTSGSKALSSPVWG